jgi:hypothetical protein
MCHNYDYVLYIFGNYDYLVMCHNYDYFLYIFSKEIYPDNRSFDSVSFSKANHIILPRLHLQVGHQLLALDLHPEHSV